MKILTIDLGDYVDNGSIFKRTAVRGIIQKDGKYLMIYSKYGDHKFPGGGSNQDESLEQTLVREVQEETGYLVNVESILDGILVHEKRKGHPEDLLEMYSYYFYCNVSDHPGEKKLDQYEKEYNYKVRWMNLEEAIEKNEAVIGQEHLPWVQREIMVMKELLKENLKHQ